MSNFGISLQLLLCFQPPVFQKHLLYGPMFAFRLRLEVVFGNHNEAFLYLVTSDVIELAEAQW